MDKINVYGMNLNQNKTLITLATDKGYKILETFKFQIVTEDNDIMELIGPLQIAQTYYESNIILFVGTEDNLNFPPSQISLWDDAKRKKIGLIMLKTNIVDLKLTKKNLFVYVKNKIVVFDFLTLKYVVTINDVTSNPKLMSVSTKINPMILAFSDSKVKRKINIIRLFSDTEANKLIGKTNRFILSKFEESQYIKLSKTAEFIAEVSKNGCKINLYSLLDFQMKKCYWRGQSCANILGLSFSKTDRFMAIINNTLTVHIYNLEDIEKHLLVIDPKLYTSDNSYPDIFESKEESHNNFSNMFTKIKDFFNNSNSSFCQYKFNFEENGEDKDFNDSGRFVAVPKESFIKITENDYQLLIFFNKVNEITIVDNRGVCERIKFDTQRTGICWNLKKIYWTCTDQLITA